MDRVPTGIPGLDSIMGGGLISTDLCLVTGPAGAGKTIFASQFIHESLNRGESAVYISFEEDPVQIRRDMAEMGWDFSEFEKSGKMAFAKYDPFHIDEVFGMIENKIREINATRVVIDSITGLTLTMGNDAERRLSIYKLGRMLRKLGCTTVMTAESPPSYREGFTEFGVEEFVSDDVVLLYYTPKGTGFNRAITVWKMRGSVHSQKIHPYDITSQGIIIYPEEEIPVGD